MKQFQIPEVFFVVDLQYHCLAVILLLECVSGIGNFLHPRLRQTAQAAGLYSDHCVPPVIESCYELLHYSFINIVTSGLTSGSELVSCSKTFNSSALR